MKKLIRTIAPAFVAGLAGAWLAMAAWPVTGEAQGYRPPRLADGHPDLNGIWQALNEANYDIQMHAARPALALRDGPYGPVPAAPVLALGAVGAVPPGVGVVEGDELPYRPEALKTKQENRQEWLSRDPEIKCYLPGVPRATYMPYPFQIVQSVSQLLFIVSVRRRGARHPLERSRTGARRFVDGPVGRLAGTATRSSSMLPA